jgi:hypothetical protein
LVNTHLLGCSCEEERRESDESERGMQGKHWKDRSNPKNGFYFGLFISIVASRFLEPRYPRDPFLPEKPSRH